MGAVLGVLLERAFAEGTSILMPSFASSALKRFLGGAAEAMAEAAALRRTPELQLCWFKGQVMSVRYTM
jgi:hypothetical protein